MDNQKLRALGRVGAVFGSAVIGASIMAVALNFFSPMTLLLVFSVATVLFLGHTFYKITLSQIKYEDKLKETLKK